MKLIVTHEELTSLIDGKFIKPHLTDNSSFIIKAVSVNGAQMELTVKTVDKKDERTAVAKDNKNSAGLSSFTTKSNSKKINSNKIDDWIDDWRRKWSGKRPKAIGNRQNCVKNLKEFFQLYPNFTKDHVYKARDNYFEGFDGDYTFLEQADYFIKKRMIKDGHTEVRRTLLIYCEEIVMREDFGIDETFSIYDDV